MSINIKKNVAAEALQSTMVALYAEGPPIIKLVTSTRYLGPIDNDVPDYNDMTSYPTGIVLGITSSTSFDLDPSTLLVKFLNVADTPGLALGVGSRIEVWNNSGTDLYFRFPVTNPLLVNGNNDLIRMPSLEMPYGVNYNLPQINYVPSAFPIQYALFFPNYLALGAATGLHYVFEQHFGVLGSEDDEEWGDHRFYAWGETPKIDGDRAGYWGKIQDKSIYDQTYVQTTDYLTFDFEWFNPLTAILTVKSVRGNINASRFSLKLLSKFFGQLEGFPNPPRMIDVDPSLYGPRTLVVQRKKYGETDFTTIPVTLTTDTGFYDPDTGIGLDSGGRLNLIDARWSWDIL